jgi:WD40 repeat protein
MSQNQPDISGTAMESAESLGFARYLQNRPLESDSSLGESEDKPATVANTAGNSHVPDPSLPHIPGYLVERVLAKGGMGVTYLAKELALSRWVVLKMMLPHLADDDSRKERFRTETETLGQLKHPNIVTIYESNEHAGQPFYSMEYVSGGSLEEWVGTKPQPPRDAAVVVETLARAMHAAHENGVIHRDLKPANILVDVPKHLSSAEALPEKSLSMISGSTVTDRAAVTVKITDFGLAKKIDQGTGDTGSDAILGTPHFMAPEQAGRAKEADQAADVYGLGAILYYLLTGRAPFTGASNLEVILKVREEEPIRPSHHVRSVPRDLETICLKCLSKEPHRRYASAAALADDLKRYLQGEPITARRAGWLERGVKWARRKPAVACAVLAASLLVLGGISFVIYDAQEQQHKADAAEKARLAAIEANNQINQARENELRQLYAADMLMASRAVTEGPLSRAVDLLNAWLPQYREGKDFRGREWHMLRRLCDTSARTMIGHSGPLRALAWSRDGKRLASGGADRVIRVWDAETGQCVRTLIGHSAGIFDLAFSPEGELLASASQDSTVRVWDVASGTQRYQLRGHILPVYAVAFHPSGKQLASGGGDCLVKIWDAATGTEQYTLQGHDIPIGRLQFSADGKRLASSGLSRGALLWDLEKRTIDFRTAAAGLLYFTPDFATAIYPIASGTFAVVDVKTRTGTEGVIGLKGIHAAVLDDSARFIAVAGADDTIHVLDRQTDSPLITHRGHAGAARRLILRPDLHKLASVGDDGTVRLWNLADPNVAKPYAGHHEHNITATAFSQDGTLLACGDYLGSIAVWDTATGRRTQILGSHYLRRKSQEVPLEIGTGRPFQKGRVPLKTYMHFTASKTLQDPIIECYTSIGHGGEVKGVAFSPDKKTLVSAGAQDFIIWDVAKGQPLQTYEHPTVVSSLALSPDGTLAATGCWDDMVRLFRVPTGELVKEFEGHGDDVMCVAFSPCGKKLATGGRDQTVIVWDVATGQIDHRLRRHTNTVSVVRYSPDGKWLVSGGFDKAIHVWSMTTGHYATTLHAHTEPITSLVFSTDGHWLVSATDSSGDAFPRIWSWNPSSRIAETAVLRGPTSKGTTSVTLHPVTGDVVFGRHQLTTFEMKPSVVPPLSTVEPVAPEVLRDKAPVDDRLKVLGYCLVDSLFAWPDDNQEPQRPSKAGSKFLVIATSLPFSRLKISEGDYRQLMEVKKKDRDATAPLKQSGMVIYPKQFVLTDAAGNTLPGQYVGRMATTQARGFDFMQAGMSMLENLTIMPQLTERQHVFLAWEVAPDFATQGLRLRFAQDEPVAVPPLKLEVFRPGKPFHPAIVNFSAEEGARRLRSNNSRAPGP